MSAFIIVHTKMKDLEKYQQYAEKAGPTLAEHGAKLLLRAKVHQVLTGTHEHSMTAIIEFPNTQAMDAWYASPAYQALIPLRERAADMTFIAYESLN